jgi:hypothetical protein
MQAKEYSPTDGQGETRPALRAIKFDAAGPFLSQKLFTAR